MNYPRPVVSSLDANTKESLDEGETTVPNTSARQGAKRWVMACLQNILSPARGATKEFLEERGSAKQA